MEKSKVKQMVKQIVKEVPKILALDLGTTTGWAIWQQREPSASYQVCSGTISLKNDRFQGGGMRYLRFRNWLDDLNYNREITSVYFEEVRRHIGTDCTTQCNIASSRNSILPVKVRHKIPQIRDKKCQEKQQPTNNMDYICKQENQENRNKLRQQRLAYQ
jgi:hypothetical protein